MKNIFSIKYMYLKFFKSKKTREIEKGMVKEN